MALAKRTVKADVSKAKKAARDLKSAVKRDVTNARKQVKADVSKARKAVEKAQTSVSRTVKADVDRVRTVVDSAASKARKQAQKIEKAVADFAAPIAQAITPSPLSRAFLATSQGKKEAAELGISPGQVPADDTTPPGQS
ncbi:hypothetical protein E4T66_06560 [Sinimarinibacterium sp. CAU 1509]|nr:hypothetical protein E4T66_06560 [Sinimarinibacterium sp. CAU 1509]